MSAPGTHIPTGFSWTVNAFIPPVYRFTDQEYAESLVSSGCLRLSSFKAFSKHKDEERLDKGEGSAMLFGNSPETNKTFFAATSTGKNAYILCTSGRSDKKIASQFDSNACVEISNPIEFAAIVAGEIPGFRQAFFGPCVYQQDRILIQATDKIAPSDFAVSPDDQSISLQKIMDKADELSGPIQYFLKPLKYVHQLEYRFVWLLNRDVENDHLDVASTDLKKILRLVAL